MFPAIASQSTLSILGLTLTWIHPEDSATPAVLSINFPFSHTPRQVGRVLVFSFLIIGNTQPTLPCAIKIILSFIMVTAPVKLQIVMICPLPHQLGTIIEELDGLLSSFSGDGSPLVVFGDFEIHLEKPYTVDFHS